MMYFRAGIQLRNQLRMTCDSWRMEKIARQKSWRGIVRRFSDQTRFPRTFTEILMILFWRLTCFSAEMYRRSGSSAKVDSVTKIPP